MFLLRLRNRKANGTANAAATGNDVFLKARWTKGFFWAQRIHRERWVGYSGCTSVESTLFTLSHFIAKPWVHREEFIFIQAASFFSPLKRNAICFTYNASICLRIIITYSNFRPFLCVVKTPSWKHNDIDTEDVIIKAQVFIPVFKCVN